MKVVPKWATVTVIEPDGRRYSINVQADSSYDAAHQFVVKAKTQRVGVSTIDLPIPTMATLFEVVTESRVYRVEGTALQKWIVKRRQELNGPKGQLFRQRPMLD
jgi:hypothetical protein